MRYGSLFTGIGGFDLGFERAGMECAWQVEIDKDCNKVLSKQFPNVERYEDVTKVERLPAVDVLAGGFPCQDLSVAGKRAGLDGERSGLWFEFLRIIESNRPRIVCIENVPGLLSSNGGRDFAVILRGLVKCGYGVAWRILDAQYDGLAQRRKRVFIVGSSGDGSCAQILFNPESVSWNPPTRGEARQGVTPILEAGARTNGDGYRDGDGIGVEGDPMFTLQRGKQHAVAGSIQSHTKRHGHAMSTQQAAESGHIVTHALCSEDASEDGTGRGTPIVPVPYTVHGEHSTAMQGKGKAAVAFETQRARSLDSTGGYATNQGGTIVAFSSKDSGADAGEISPTLRSMNFAESHINGGGQVAIAFAQNQRDEIRLQGGDGDVAGALSGEPGMKQQTYGAVDAPLVAFQERGREGGRNIEMQDDLAYSLNNPGAGGRSQERNIAGNFGVRRLTPRECEFLQGFPADWTLYDVEGKVISDSARYRMLGNAVAVPCAEWLGNRIMAVLKNS